MWRKLFPDPRKLPEVPITATPGIASDAGADVQGMATGNESITHAAGSGGDTGSFFGAVTPAAPPSPEVTSGDLEGPNQYIPPDLPETEGYAEAVPIPNQPSRSGQRGTIGVVAAARRLNGNKPMRDEPHDDLSCLQESDSFEAAREDILRRQC